MIWVTQKKQQIEMLLLEYDQRLADNKLNVSYQIETDLLAIEVADDYMIWGVQKKQQIEMILLVWSEE